MTRPAGSAKLLRAINSSAALSHLLSNGRLTRAELRALTGLSKPTSSEMLRVLTDAGLAVVAGRTTGGPGPTAEIYSPNPDAAYVVAVSVRDTTGEDRPGLAYAVADLTGAIRFRDEERLDYARTSPAGVVSRAVTNACAGAGLDQRRVRRVQIGVAGSYDARTDTIGQIDVPGWGQAGIAASIRAELGDTAEVAVENDVNLAASAERHHGAAGAESFAMLWLDHGIGLAIDLGGSPLRGARGSAGEIGYLPVRYGDGPGPVDLQDLVGGPAVVQLAADHGVTAEGPGSAVAAALPVAAFRDELAHRIAFVLTTVTAVLDPPLVVLAGAVAQAGGEELRRAVLAAGPAEFDLAVTIVADDPVLLGGLGAGQQALRDSLITALGQLD
jgi:predicted NBD/HSP70 family sugar kinase